MKPVDASLALLVQRLETYSSDSACFRVDWEDLVKRAIKNSCTHSNTIVTLDCSSNLGNPRASALTVQYFPKPSHFPFTIHWNNFFRYHINASFLSLCPVFLAINPHKRCSTLGSMLSRYLLMEVSFIFVKIAW